MIVAFLRAEKLTLLAAGRRFEVNASVHRSNQKLVFPELSNQRAAGRLRVSSRSPSKTKLRLPKGRVSVLATGARMSVAGSWLAVSWQIEYRETMP